MTIFVASISCSTNSCLAFYTLTYSTAQNNAHCLQMCLYIYVLFNAIYTYSIRYNVRQSVFPDLYIQYALLQCSCFTNRPWNTTALEEPYQSANTDRNRNLTKSYYIEVFIVHLTQVLAGNRQLTHQRGWNNHHRLFPSDHCSRLPIVLHGVDHCLPVGVAQLKTTPAWC